MEPTRKPETTWTIRRGTPADGAGLLRVHRDSILTLGRVAYTAAEAESWASGLRAEGYGTAMTEGGEAFLVGVDRDGRVIAFCSYREDEVCGLYVAPDRARRGLGRALLRRAEDAIRAAGHRRVRVGASLNGRPFYEAQGYRVVERKGWKTRGGLVIDVVWMEKPVP